MQSILSFIRNVIKKSIPYVPYTAVVLVITGPFFLKSGYLFFSDFVIGPNIVPDISNYYYFRDVIFWLLSFVFPVAILEKCFISAVIIVVLLGGKKLASIFVQSPLYQFPIALFALFNPFVYDRLMYGQVGVVCAYACLLFFTAYLFEFKNVLKNKTVYLAGLSAGLMVLSSPHFIFIITGISLPFIITHIHDAFSCVNRADGRMKMRRLLLSIGACAGIIIIINGQWLLGEAVLGSKAGRQLKQINFDNFYTFRTVGSGSTEVASNVLLMFGFWGEAQNRYVGLKSSSGVGGRSMIIFTPIILFGLYFFIKDRKKKGEVLADIPLYLPVLFIISVILAMGVGSSITAIFTRWLFDTVPFYESMRDTTKWISLISVLYVVWLSYGLSQIERYEYFSKKRLVVVILLSAAAILQAHFLLFGYFGQVRPTSYPREWFALDSYMQKIEHDNCKQTTLFLPWHMYMSFSFTGAIVGNPAQKFFTCPVLSGTNMEMGGLYDTSGSRDGQIISDWIKVKGDMKQSATGAFISLPISYIILTKDVDWDKYRWLDLLPYIQLEKDFGSIVLFKVNKSAIEF